MKIGFAFLLFVTMSWTAWAKDVKVVGQEFMPIEGRGPSGKMEGVHYEAVKRVCTKLGYNCTFEIVPLARALDMIKSGEAHIVVGIAKNPEREAILNFPGMISQGGYTFFVKKGQAAKLNKIEDLKGRTIGVHGGSATHKDLVEQNKKLEGALKIVEESVAETSSRKLAGGRYGDDAAIYCTRPVCLYQAKKENLDIEPISFDAKIQSHTAPISKTAFDAAELEKYKKALIEVMKSEEVKKIFADANVQIHPDMK